MTPSASPIGSPVRRVEDRRLLTGAGRYSDDSVPAGQVYAVMVRSIDAHADLGHVNTAPAEGMPGVLAVLDGEDWLAEGLNPMPAWGNPKDVELKNKDGSEIFYTPLYPLVTDRIRRAGDVVAVVVAETLAEARDAAERVDVQCTPLQAVSDGRAALAPGAPELWHEVPGNLNVDDEKGSIAQCDAAFASAAHVVEIETFNQRVTGVPMEPRVAIGEYDPEASKFTLEAGGQGVNRFQNELAATFGVGKDKVRVISRDVGGGYGTRNHTYPEFALVLWAAKRVGRPVKWICERSEAFLSDYAGRDLFTKAALALDEDGTFLAMRTENIANIGTHTVSYVPLARGPTVYNGVYDIPLVHAVSKAALTNTTAVASYRGAGRPESMFVIERLVDLAASAAGLDRIALRRKNMIAEDAIPYTNDLGVTYDSGKFETSMDMAMNLVDWDGFPARKADWQAKGFLAGIGLANYIETASGYPLERGEMTVLPEGRVELILGTQSSGQSHETTFAQVVSEWLGVDIGLITLKTGDTDFLSVGSGSHSSRSMRLAGHLYKQTTDAIIERGCRIAAVVWETGGADVSFNGGYFQLAGTNRSLHLFEVAEFACGDALPAELAGPLTAAADIAAPLPTYPNGCHACEVCIDLETGEVRVVRYAGVDDVGRVINPLVVDGQAHGGIAQGIGQALMEECVYQPENAQLLAGSFLDYAMPRAGDFPNFALANNEVPAPNNYLGVKGAGEGGTTAAPAAIINAIVDALSAYGVTHVDMPATPHKIWSLIHNST